jgi:uncharacterized protein YndB with AHSA1/START domain
VGAIVLIVLLFGFASPRVATMERSVTINAPAEKVFPYLNNLKNFVDNWSPWSEKDPNATHEYNDIASGVGAFYSWKGEPKKVGEGSMKIVECEENKRVKTLLSFKGRGDAFAGWTVVDNGDSVKVTWDFEADNGMNPVGRIFGRFMDKFLGPDYENGLNKLKKVVES